VVNDAFLKIILWTDECVFHSDGRINRHNEHHNAEENSHCRKTTHIQGYYSVKVWAGILDDMIIESFFFPENHHVNGEIYADFIEHIVNDLLKDVPLALHLTSLDFFLWGYLKDQVYQILPQNRDDLINCIQTAFLQISPQMLSRVRESFVTYCFM